MLHHACDCGIALWPILSAALGSLMACRARFRLVRECDFVTCEICVWGRIWGIGVEVLLVYGRALRRQSESVSWNILTEQCGARQKR